MMLCKTLDKVDLPLFLAVNKGDWIAEVKEDGDRMRMVVKDKQITLLNRNNRDVTDKYPEFTTIDLPDCMIDGEMCVLDERGVSQFNEGISFRTHCKAEQKIRTASAQYPVTYILFDLLELDGEDLRAKPLHIRVTSLHHLNVMNQHKNIKIVEQTTDIIQLWETITSLGGEGIILKKRDSSYLEGKRNGSWLKVKDIKEVDLSFVKYETHNNGITVTSDKGIRVTVNGQQSKQVAQLIDADGQVNGTIRHLGQTKTDKYRQPTWAKVVVR